MEFKEFSNPEEANYDITSAKEETETYSNIDNPYDEQLIGLIGILEDVSNEELLSKYGITYDEYLHPNAEVIAKVMDTIQLNEGFSRGKRL